MIVKFSQTFVWISNQHSFSRDWRLVSCCFLVPALTVNMGIGGLPQSGLTSIKGKNLNEIVFVSVHDCRAASLSWPYSYSPLAGRVEEGWLINDQENCNRITRRLDMTRDTSDHRVTIQHVHIYISVRLSAGAFLDVTVFCQIFGCQGMLEFTHKLKWIDE